MKNLILISSILLIAFTINNENQTNDVVNQISYKDKTLMAVFAHSDDEVHIAPILSKYSKEGINIYIVTVTDGSKGVTSHANIPAGDSLAKVRAEESVCITKKLGVNPPIFLNYIDGDLSLPKNIATLDNAIDSLFTKYQPNTILTLGPDGGYGHPDHRVVSNIVTEVFQKKASDTIQQLLYFGLPNEYIKEWEKLNNRVAGWIKNSYKTTQKRFLTYQIPFNEEDFKTGKEALFCAKSQFIPEIMDEIMNTFSPKEKVIYFRPWNGSNGIKTSVFD